jgi:riboflavin kinase/FMN adenylyltransferase
MYLSLSANTNIANPKQPQNLVATLGSFDGIHLGHQLILKNLVERAQELNVKSAVICFYPHPSKIIRGQSVPKIFSLRQQLQKLRELGVDYLCFLNFNKAFAALEPEQFVDRFLINEFAVKELLVGPFAAIGKKRRGDLKWMQEYLPKKNIQITVVSAQLDSNDTDDAERISSNRIRTMLSCGDFMGAERLLGHPFSILARVRQGQQLGRQLGFKTANLDLAGRVKIPFGVYAVRARLQGIEYNAVANYGLRPTVTSSTSADKLLKDVFEVHLIGYDGNDFYREYLEVMPIYKIREEKKFASLDQLKLQIGLDLEQAKEILLAK